MTWNIARSWNLDRTPSWNTCFGTESSNTTRLKSPSLLPTQVSREGFGWTVTDVHECPVKPRQSLDSRWTVVDVHEFPLDSHMFWSQVPGGQPRTSTTALLSPAGDIWVDSQTADFNRVSKAWPAPPNTSDEPISAKRLNILWSTHLVYTEEHVRKENHIQKQALSIWRPISQGSSPQSPDHRQRQRKAIEQLASNSACLTHAKKIQMLKSKSSFNLTAEHVERFTSSDYGQWTDRYLRSFHLTPRWSSRLPRPTVKHTNDAALNRTSGPIGAYAHCH